VGLDRGANLSELACDRDSISLHFDGGRALGGRQWSRAATLDRFAAAPLARPRDPPR
jgi:hypothetical protein